MLQSLSQGNKNDYVKVAKYLMGYSAAGKATNSFDAKFLTYVKTWQKEHGLSGLGTIGPKTWVKIAENAPELTDKTSAAIYAFQILFDKVAVNGKWNTVTQNAVKNFKKACGFNVDTKMTPEVWKQLLALDAKKHKHTVNYKQNDKKWTNVVYSKTGKATGQTIGNSGCGPTACSNIVASLKDSSITPVEMCKFACSCGARRNSGGTDMEILAPKVQEKWNFSRMVECKNLTIVKHCLDCGGYVVVGVGKGWFTSVGHYMTIWDVDNKYVYVDNPISNIKVKREISKFTPEVNYYFCFYA